MIFQNSKQNNSSIHYTICDMQSLLSFINHFEVTSFISHQLIFQYNSSKEEVINTAIQMEKKSKTRHSKARQSLLIQMSQRKKKILTEDEINRILSSKKEKKKEKPLKECYCNYSFYVFSKENKIRIYCWNFTVSIYFEIIVNILIILSSIQLAMDTYYVDDEENTVSKVLSITNYFFTISFAIETLIKSITYGLLFDKNTYLRDTWNQLDFIIVVLSLVDIAIPEIDVQIFKIFRLLRTIRPLRFVTHNSHMRILVKALFKSLGSICNTIFVVLLFYVMFSILGVSFFANKFNYCSVEKYENSSPEECVESGGVWKIYDHNFESVLNGLIQEEGEDIFQYMCQFFYLPLFFLLEFIQLSKEFFRHLFVKEFSNKFKYNKIKLCIFLKVVIYIFLLFICNYVKAQILFVIK